MSDADARIAALEAQVARLTAAVDQSAAPEGGERATSSYDRRTLLRRGGLALAAGAVALPALARPAAAATGDPLLIGRDNTAGDGSVTGLTAKNANAPTMALANTASATDPQDSTLQLASPSLRLVPSDAEGGPDYRASQAGDLLSSGDLLYYTHVGPEGSAPSIFGSVHTSAYATYIDFLAPPFRALDTRRTAAAQGNAGRELIVDTPSSAFDSGGRLRGGQTLTLDLSDLLLFAGNGVFGNITVVSPDRTGYFTVYAAGQQQPETSNINYLARQTLANFTMSELGASTSATDAISIFTQQTAHVLFDVFAFSVWEPGAVNPAYQTGAARAQARARGRARLSRG